MAVQFLKYTWQRVLAKIILIFVITILIAAYFVNRYWSPILAEKVKVTVLASTDSLYVADFKDADFHILQGKLVIHNITVKPNMAVYNRNARLNYAPNNLYRLQVKKLVIKHMHPLRLYFDDKLDIGQIILSAPELQVTYRLNHKTDSLPKDRLNAWQRIRPMLKSIHIGQVMLNDVKFKYSDYSGHRLDISELKEMNLTGNDLLIDSTTQNDKSRFYYFKDVQIELNNFKRSDSSGLYYYQVKQLRFSTLSSRLQANGLSVLPADEAVFLSRNIRNRYAFYADTLQADSFDFKTYNKYRSLYTSKIQVTRGNFSVLTNTAAPASKGNRLRSFPNVAIQQLANTVKIDTIALQHINFTYKGYGKRSHKPGQVTFNNTSGLILNITNHPAALKRNNLCQMQFTSQLMNEGALSTNATFNLTDSAKSYTYRGSLGSMNLNKLNPVTMPFALVKIASGRLQHFNFDITGNRHVSHGKVTLLYNDLRIRLLKTDSTRYRKRTIISMMANAMIVKHNNPDTIGAQPRSYDVTYVRQPDTPFFKSVWKTLAMGIKSTAGYDPATEKRIKNTIARHQANKQQHQAQKALRRKRGTNRP